MAPQGIWWSWKVLTWSLWAFRGRCRVWKCLLALVTLHRVKSIVVQEGAGLGAVGGREGPCPMLAGVEVRHSAPAPAGVGQWQGPATLCWAVRAGHFVKLHHVHFKKTQKIHSKITVFSPKQGKLHSAFFTLKVKRFSANSSEQGLTHGCSPTSQWVQHGAWFQLCLLLSALTRGGMDGKDGVTRFSLSFPLISHLLWYLVVTSCRLTCRYDTLWGAFGGETGKRGNLYLNNCSTSSEQEGHRNS